MKNVRVDFSAHMSIVVQVGDGDDYLDRAMQLAEQYVDICSIRPSWEIDGDGVDDVDNSVEVDVKEESK